MKPWRRTLRIAAELLAMVALLAWADLKLTGGTGFAGIAPNPYWLPVLAMALAYGTGAALAAAAVASLSWLTAPHAPLGVGEDAFAHLLDRSLPPMLWVLAAVTVGEVTAWRVRSAARADRRGAALARNCATMIDAYRSLADTNRALQLRIALEERDVASALTLAAGLRGAGPQWRTIGQLIALDTRCEDFSLYLEQGGRWRRIAHGNAAAARAEIAGQALAQAAMRCDRALSVADATDRAVLGDHGVAAVALRAGDDASPGLLVLHDLPVDRLTRHALIGLSATAAWLGAALSHDTLRPVARAHPAPLRVVGSDIAP